jgi:hypothetical protein
MSHGQEMIDVTTRLARVRADLLVAITADRLRSRRRRRARIAALATGATLAVIGTGVAATVGVFSPAPDDVKETFAELDGVAGGPEIDASKAVEIGEIDDHAAYAAPTANGGFCLYFAPNPRSGPSGSQCTVNDAGPGEIVFNVSVGHDGGFVFGRVGTESATTVEIELPGGRILSTPVAESRFFLADLSTTAMRSLMTGESFDLDRIEAITAMAKDADGTAVGRAAAGAIEISGLERRNDGRWVPRDMGTETGPVP